MTTLIERLARLLGIRGLDLRSNLSERDRDRMILASLVPALAIICLLISLAMQIGFDTGFSFDPEKTPDDWPRRIEGAASYAAGFLAVLSVAILFIASTRETSKAMGSWAAVFAGAMIVTAVGAASFVVFVFLETSSSSLGFGKWYVLTWAQLAYISGLIAIGYSFLAFRGLATSGSYGRRLSARRRRNTA